MKRKCIQMSEFQLLFVKDPDRDEQNKPQIDHQSEEKLADSDADRAEHEIAEGVAGKSRVMESLDMEGFHLWIQGEQKRGKRHHNIEQKQ